MEKLKKKNSPKEFIESLSQLDNFETDLITKEVDEALAIWIINHKPRRFEIDFKRRDLVIAAIKKNAIISNMIKSSAFKPYIDAVIEMKWRKYVKAIEAKQKIGEKVDKIYYYNLFLEFVREIFALGYSLKSLEDPEKGENKSS